VVIRLPIERRPDGVEVDLGTLRAPARLTATLLLLALMVVGVSVAIVSALAAQRDSTEAIGTLGTELGAAMWFAGAVTWGGRRGATVGRAALLVATFLAGLALILTALLADWSGARLDLAMEFGVGMLAVPVIDVVVIGLLHRNLAELGSATGPPLVVSIGRDGRVVRVAAPGR
jgi:hypothetical protein